MKVRKGFCCNEFERAYINGISLVTKVPDVKDFPKMKEVCSFCGKDIRRYTNRYEV